MTLKQQMGVQAAFRIGWAYIEGKLHLLPGGDGKGPIFQN